jgi:hypothetical protein
MDLIRVFLKGVYMLLGDFNNRYTQPAHTFVRSSIVRKASLLPASDEIQKGKNNIKQSLWNQQNQ